MYLGRVDVKLQDKDWKELIKYVLAVCICILFWFAIERINILIGAIKEFLVVVSPLIIGFVIAYILVPFVDSVRKKLKCDIKLAITLVYIGIIMTLIILLSIVLPQVYNSLLDLSEKVPYIYDLVNKYSEYTNIKIDNTVINNSLKDIIGNTQQIIENIVPMIYDIGKGVTTVIVNMLISVAISIYIIADRDKLKNKFKYIVKSIVGDEKSNSIASELEKYSDIFRGFLVGKIIDSAIIGVITFILTSLFGLRYNALVAIIVGVLNIIPYFGPFIGAIPCIIIYLSVDIKSGIIFTVLILAIQQFDGIYLGPKILGNKLGVTPLLILISITIGGHYLGVIGMIIGVPIAIILCNICDEILERRNSR